MLDSELNDNIVREIVSGVYQRKGLPPPYAVDFRPRDESETKAFVYLQDECLHVVASNEPDLKRAIGRYIIKSVWSRRDWLLATRAGLYASVYGSIMIAIAIFAASFTYLSPAIGYWISISCSTIIAILALWSSRQLAIKSYDLRRSFAIQMADLECMTEFDAHDYEETSSLIVHSGFFIVALGVMLAILLAMPFDLEAVWIIIPEAVLLLVAALIVLFKSPFKSIDTNLCYEENDSEEEEDKFDDSDYLQEAFTEIIEHMSLWGSLKAKHASDIQALRARYFETRYAQCRGVYDYVEDGTLYIDAVDISEEAARRFGAAVLATGSLSFYRDLSFSRRAIMGAAFFFGLIMLMVILLGGLMISKEFGIASIVITSLVFSKMWHIGWKQNEEVRRDLPVALQKTRVFKDYELRFYQNHMFSTTSRFDFGFLVGFHVVLAVMGYLLLAFW